MGATQSKPIQIGTQEQLKPKCKPCCACPETRDRRDKCVFENGEENCLELIKAHQDCMRSMGFDVNGNK